MTTIVILRFMFSLARHRLGHWREVISWPVGIVLALISFFSLLAFLRDEMLPADIAVRYKVISFLPSWHWYYWVIIILSVLIIGILEGSFRLVNKKYSDIEINDGITSNNISLYDAAISAYEETIESYGEIARQIERNDPESLVILFSYALVPKLKIFGERPPSRKCEVYSDKEHRNDYDFKVEDNKVVAVERYGKGRWVNLNVCEDELKSAIQSMKKWMV